MLRSKSTSGWTWMKKVSFCSAVLLCTSVLMTQTGDAAPPAKKADPTSSNIAPPEVLNEQNALQKSSKTAVKQDVVVDPRTQSPQKLRGPAASPVASLPVQGGSGSRVGGDTCATATVVPGLPYSDSGNTSGFTDVYDEICPFNTPGSPDVVYSYTPAANETVDISLCTNSAYDTKLYVYENVCGGYQSGTAIACNDDACSTPSFPNAWVSRILGLNLTAGNTYYIVVDGYAGDSGDYTLDIAGPPPCQVDGALAAPGSINGNTCGQGNDCALRPSVEHVIEVTLPNDGIWTFDTCGSAFDTWLFVGTTCCGSQVGNNDDSCGLQSSVTAFLTAGTYYATIEAFGSTQCGDYILNVTKQVAQPSCEAGGDTCANPLVVAGLPYSDAGNTCNCTDTYDEICPFDTPGSPDRVYAFTPAADINVDITLCGDSAYDTKLYVYENVCGGFQSGTAIACNDDACSTPSFAAPFVSRLNCVPMAAGNTYYIIVDGYDFECGNYTIDITECIPCVVACPDGSTPENEPNCGIPDDTVNGGCNSAPPVFSTITCGETVCGTGAFDGATRDTDWYMVNVTTDTIFTWTVEAEFDALIGLVATDPPGSGSCGDVLGIIDPAAFPDACTVGSVTTACLPPGNYMFFVAPLFGDPVPCGAQYWARLDCVDCEPPTGACCFSDGTCLDSLSQGDCGAQGGTYQGDNSDCASVNCPIAPSNDLCENAIGPLAVPSSTAGSTALATVDSGFPFCGTSITSPGVWYTVLGTGNTMTATTCGPFFGYDTKISVYCNSCTSPLCVGGNDDSCAGGASGLLSTVTWCSELGTEYLILVHGFGGQSGDFVLDVFDDGVACGNPPTCSVEPCDPGNDCSDPLPVAGIPFSDTGNTCGCTNNYDEVCPFTGSTSPDRVYAFTPAADVEVNISLCTNSAYDTKLYVYVNSCPGTVLGCNDDDCSTPSFANPWVSRLRCLPMQAGNTYYIVVDGFGGECGDYTIDITVCEPCVECPEEGIDEGEGDCFDGYDDTYNAGCNNPTFASDCCFSHPTPGCDDAACQATVCAADPFCCNNFWDGLCAAQAATMCGTLCDDPVVPTTPIECGDTVCGTYGTFIGPGGGSFRDTDWYELHLPADADVTWTVTGDADTLFFILVPAPDCNNLDLGPVGLAAECETGSIVRSLSAGGPYYLFVSTQEFTGVPCGSGYVATVECDFHEPVGGCCVDENCFIATEADCLAEGGEYLGDGTDCSPTGATINVYASGPVNIPIPDNTPAGISHTITVPDSFTVQDVNVGLSINHTWVGDLCVTLRHVPSNTSVDLIQRPGAAGACHQGSPFGCDTDNYIGIILDDQGTIAIEAACSNNLTSPPNYIPNNLLAAFNGLNSAGDWELTVSDNAAADTGTFVSWSLEFAKGGDSPCVEVPCEECPPGTTPIEDASGNFAGWCASTSHPNNVVIETLSVDLPGNTASIHIIKEFKEPPGFGGLVPPILIDFVQVCPNNKTVNMIVIESESIQNATGVDWLDFHWLLFDGPDAWFVADAAGADFVGPNFASALFSGFLNPPTNTQAKSLTAYNGLVANGAVYAPGSAPTGRLKIGVDLSGPQRVSFTLKERPTLDGEVQIGACCVGLDCAILTEGDCVASGGIYKGDGTVCTPQTCLPEHDDCDNCIEVQTGVPFTGSSEGATGVDITSCAFNDFRDVWHCWTATCTGTATINTCGSQFDTTLAVFDACGGAQLACNDDTPACPDTLHSQVSIPVTQGTTYYIRVSGFNGATGTYTLNVSCTTPATNKGNQPIRTMTPGQPVMP